MGSRSSVTVNLKGGLGNQMFQYALGYRLFKELKLDDLFVDLRFLSEAKLAKKKGYVVRDYDLDIFSINIREPGRKRLLKSGMLYGGYESRERISKAINFFNGPSIMEGKDIHDLEYFSRGYANIYLNGYWQSEIYFDSAKEEIQNLFQIDQAFIEQTQTSLTMKNDILTSISVCLNVRRGDFIGNLHHDVIAPDYYQKSLALIKESVSKDIKVFIFSDDIEWCKVNLNFKYPTIYVEHYLAGKKWANYLDLMMSCKHFIIPNSTFAWWAAWLAGYKKKIVVAPKRWSGLAELKYEKVIPKRWHCL